MSNTEPHVFEPMTTEMLEMIRPKETYLDSGFLYGNNWECTAGWYKRHFPGFSDETCQVLQKYSDGIRPKQFKSMLKRQRKIGCLKSKNEAS